MHTRIGPVLFVVAALSVLSPTSVQAAENFEEAMQAVSEAMLAHDLEKALSLTRAAHTLAETPEEHCGTYVLEGSLCERLKRNVEAREAFRAALAVEGIDPDKRFSVYMLITFTYDSTEEAAAIQATYAEALKEDLSPPWRCVALAGFAGACEQEGEHGAALAAYDEILRTEGATPEQKARAHEAIGDIHVEQEEYEKALEDYVKALTLPDAAIRMFKPICCGVGKALMGLGRHAEARQVLLTCAENEDLPTPARDTAFWLLIDSLEEQGAAEEAGQLEKQRWELDSDQKLDRDLVLKAQSDYKAASLLAIGRHYKDTGRGEAALAACEAILELPGISPDRKSRALLAIGALHLEQGNRDEARKAFERVVQMEEAPAEVREEAQAHLDEMD